MPGLSARSALLSPHALFIACLLLTVAVYWPGLAGDFMFDDRANLLENQALAMDELSLDALHKAALSSNAGTLRRPVSMVSFALNRHFFGIEPGSYKVTNLVIHLLTGVLLYLLASRLLTSYRQLRQPAASGALVRWLPAIVAGLWLVHPLNLTSVLYIVQRMTSLSSLFMVAGLWLYIVGRQRMLVGHHGLAWLFAGLAGMGALAVLSKETGILLPLYILVVEVTLFRCRDAHGRTDRAVALFIGACIVLPVLLGGAYLLTHADSFLNYASRDFSLQERLLTEARVLLLYIKLLVAPSVQQLGLYHDDIALSTGLLSPWTTLASSLALAALLLAAALCYRRQPLVSLGILWFFVGHLLESTILPLELAHEHRNYLPGFGLLLAGGAALAALPAPKLAPLLTRALPVLLLLLYGGTTLVRSTQWSDNVNHAIYEARHHPDSPRAVFSAGRIYARLALQGHDESIEPAFEHFRRTAVLDRRGVMPLVAQAKFAYLLGRDVEVELFDAMIERLAGRPPTPSDIRSVQELADCTESPCAVPRDRMRAIFQAAHKGRNPRLLTLQAFYDINKLGDVEAGLAGFRRVVELAPANGDHWKNLINLLMVMNRFDAAQAALDGYRQAQPLGTVESDYAALEADIDAGREQLQTAHKETNDHE